MKLLKPVLAVLLIITGYCIDAQSSGTKQRMKITDSGELYSTFNWDDNSAAKSAVVVAVSTSEFSDIIKYSNESNWPSGISTLDGRDALRTKINEYVAYKVAEFDNMVLLKIPAAENKSMPYNMQSPHDFYFVIGKTGVQTYSGTTVSAQKGVRMKITDSGDLYSTYDIEGTSEAVSEIKRVASGSYYDIVKTAKESAWPAGIATLDARDKVRTKMNDYVVYKVAEFDGKYLLKVPADENKHMPYNMRADYDFYFVIGTTGARMDGGSSNNTYGNKGIKATINSTGGMYSTFDLANSGFTYTLKSQLGSEYDDVLVYSKEANWPYGISTFDSRDKHRQQLNNYTAYKIAEFDDKYILRIPASENNYMPQDMRPTHDIYFIINKTNVSLY
ncbi:MAG: hypothetical protein U0V74_12470 [Chitinophagales bacterium]